MSLPTPYYERDGITIYHGDCLEILPHLDADVVVTDPPYGVCWSAREGNAPVIAGERYVRRGSDREIQPSDYALRDAALSATDAPAVCFGSWRVPKPKGTRWCCIWDKGRPGLGGYGPWRASFEEVYFTRAHTGFWSGGGAEQSVIRVKGTGNKHHPTEKPVALMSLLLGWATGTILDPFMGSGTTLVAAKLEGRKAIGIELEERYCEIAVKRLAQGVLDFG